MMRSSIWHVAIQGRHCALAIATETTIAGTENIPNVGIGCSKTDMRVLLTMFFLLGDVVV